MQSFTPYNPNFSGNRWKKKNIAATTWGAGLVLPRFLPRCLYRCSVLYGMFSPKKIDSAGFSERLVLLTLAISWSSARGSAISPTILGVVASTPWKWWWLRVNAVRQRRHFLKHKVHCYSTQGLRPVIKRNSIQVDRDHLNISEHSFWNLKSTSNLPFTISSSTCVTVYSTTLGTAKQLLGGFVDTLPKTKPWKVLMKLWYTFKVRLSENGFVGIPALQLQRGGCKIYSSIW